ncbi:MAG: hypothetical protein V3U92_02190 [Cellulophaga sp.]
MTKKTIKRASADVGFIFIAYNLKRIMNIIGIEKLMEIMASFSVVFIVKKASYKLLKSKTCWIAYICTQSQNIAIILLNLKYKKLNSSF